MSDCCSFSCHPSQSAKKHCPVNGVEYRQVSYRTVIHHLQRPWQWEPTTQNYYFCDDPECNVVYFGDDDSTIEKDRLRTPVGVKEQSDDSTICYCFGVTKGEAIADESIKDYVATQTIDHMCDCEIRNPSGKCCLRDFPKS
jgi:hypothetical protein